MKAIGLQFSKTYLHAALAHEENRISIKRKQYSIVFLVLFSLLWVILRHKLIKRRIFTTQLRRSLFKCREGYRITILKDLSSRSVCAKRKPDLYKRKQYSIVFLVLFSLLYVILRHKLDKCKIFTKQLRRSVFKCREGYRITKLKDLSSRSVCARRKPNFYKMKTIFYSIFSALFIAVGYIAAQAR